MNPEDIIQDPEVDITSQATEEAAQAAAAAGGDNGNAAETPWYSRFGAFESEDAFQSHFAEIQAKAAEAEALAARQPERRYVSNFTEAIDNLLEVQVAAGKTPDEAMAEVFKFAVETSKPWKEIAKTDPFQVLLEKECRDMPEIDRATHERVLRSQYKLPPEPDASDEEARVEWEDMSKIINAKMAKEAVKAAADLEAKKGTYGLSPDVAQYIESRREAVQNQARLAPEYEATLKKVASSLEFSHNGVTVPVKVFEGDGRLAKGMEFLAKEHVNLGLLCDSKGSIDGEKVAKYIVGGWFGLEGTVKTLMDLSAKKEGPKANREVINSIRNPNDAPARGGAATPGSANRVNQARILLGRPPIE